jgi:hypothetical protein
MDGFDRCAECVRRSRSYDASGVPRALGKSFFYRTALFLLIRRFYSFAHNRQEETP